MVRGLEGVGGGGLEAARSVVGLVVLEVGIRRAAQHDIGAVALPPVAEDLADGLEVGVLEDAAEGERGDGLAGPQREGEATLQRRDGQRERRVLKPGREQDPPALERDRRADLEAGVRRVGAGRSGGGASAQVGGGPDGGAVRPGA